MKIVLMSDTHSLHARLTVPPCDLLIHAGDFTGNGSLEHVVDFLQWFERQPAKRRVFVAGNHDIFLEKCPAEFERMLRSYDVTYLNDSGTEVDGLKIWGSPITPTFFDWAFMRDRGPAIRKHWDTIPDDTDILITHGPPRGIGDRNFQVEKCGCDDLLDRVLMVSPKIHAFGHIHEGRGMYVRNGATTRFVNASNLCPNAIGRMSLYEPLDIDL